MKILIIRLKYIGDVLLSSVLCNSLKKSFPDAQIDYLMHQTSADLFQHHPYIDNVISITDYERKHFLAYFSKMREVANNQYDIIIDTSSTAKTELVSLLARNTKFKIGRAKRSRGFFYTHKLFAHQLTGNKLEQRLKLLQPLLENGFEISLDRNFCLSVTDDECSEMASRLSNSGVDLTKPIFVFAVSSREKHKQWDLTSMQFVVEYCLESTDAQIVLMAGLPHERIAVTNFHQQMKNHPRVFSEVHTNSLRELAVLFCNVQLFVGNEGGPRHIAEAMKVPTVTVVSPSANKYEWLPQSSLESAVEWRDVDPTAHQSTGGVTAKDPNYQSLYDLIKPGHVITLIDKQLRKSKNENEYKSNE